MTQDRIFHSLDETAELLGIGRSGLYNIISAGELKTVHIGRRHLVPADELEAYAARVKDSSWGTEQ